MASIQTQSQINSQNNRASATASNAATPSYDPLSSIRTPTTPTPGTTNLASTTAPTTVTPQVGSNNLLNAIPGPLQTNQVSSKKNSSVVPAMSSNNTQNDFRIRLSVKDPSVYGNGLISPLIQTNGMLFPYTPSISLEGTVDYSTMAMVHSNTDFNYYMRTPNQNISVTGKFTFQNQTEGQYMMASIHFLKTIMKMNFGMNDPNAGLPPPPLFLSGYGAYMFNNVRVLLKNWSTNLEDHVDYIPLTTYDGTVVRLPAVLSITVQLTVQPTTKMATKQFTLDAYRSGQLLQSGGWF